MQGRVMMASGGWILWLLSWIVAALVIVSIIRFALRPTNERLDRLIRQLEQRRDAGA
ncbi:MAG: hypothetical protein HYV19_05615 [Gemmatimonadetes bacterium]|nr:hypothetical protein [Gemmatimonadota bacterium]